MEEQASKLTIIQQLLLEELCFVTPFNDLYSISKDENLLKIALLGLLINDFIQVYDISLEQEITVEIEEFDTNFKEYYYLATKKGLKVIF